jgi:hypothetical protein
VTDLFGRRFSYSGVVPRRRDGSYDTDVMGSGEFIAEPGLVYRLEGGKVGNGKRLMGGSPDPKARSAVLEEQRKVMRQISLTIVFWLTGAFAVQLLLSALGAG